MPNDIHKIQSEIKDVVISKLLDQVITQHKELSRLQLENSDLKITITDLYKKIIIMKSLSSNSLLSKKQKETKANHSQDTFGSYSPNVIHQCSSINNVISKPSPFNAFSPISAKTSTHRIQLNHTTNKVFFRNKLNGKNSKMSASLLSDSSSLVETQSCVFPSVDRTNTSRLLTNTSSKIPLMGLSPRIGEYYRYNKGEQKTSTASVGNKTTQRNNYELKAKRLRIIKKYEDFIGINGRVIKVTLKNSSDSNSKLNNMTIC